MDGTVRPDMLSDQITEDAGARGRRRPRRAGGRGHARPRGHRDAGGGEARHAAPAVPRATGASTATMELLRSWGLEPQVRDAALDVEWRALATPTLAGAATGRADRGRLPARPTRARVVSPTAPACVPQDELERILEEHLATLPSVRLERGVEIATRREPRRRRDRPRRRRPHDPRPLPGRRRRHPQHRARRARHPGVRLRPARRAPQRAAARAAVGARGRAPPRHLLPRRRGRRRAR